MIRSPQPYPTQGRFSLGWISLPQSVLLYIAYPLCIFYNDDIDVQVKTIIVAKMEFFSSKIEYSRSLKYPLYSDSYTVKIGLFVTEL